jgi:hypothetical protein
MFEVQFMIGDLKIGHEKLGAKTLLGAKREVNRLTWSGLYINSTACIYEMGRIRRNGLPSRFGWLTSLGNVVPMGRAEKVKIWTDFY